MVMPTLNLPQDELKHFADAVLERFCNPFVDHQVTSIMLNSFPKYATRDLPGLKTYLKRKGHLPEGLVLGLAAIMVYYRGGKRADGADIVPNDAPEIMELLSKPLERGRCGEPCQDSAGTDLYLGRGSQRYPWTERPCGVLHQPHQRGWYARYGKGAPGFRQVIHF